MFSLSSLPGTTTEVGNCLGGSNNSTVYSPNTQLFLNLYRVNSSLLHIHQYSNSRAPLYRSVIA
jgi:hypothetical protein